MGPSALDRCLSLSSLLPIKATEGIQAIDLLEPRNRRFCADRPSSCRLRWKISPKRSLLHYGG